MKILIPVDPEIPVPPTHYGGVERLVDGLITAYRKNGHEVYLLAHPESAAVDTTVIFKWNCLNSRGFLNTWKNAWKLFKIAHKVKPDVIHSFGRLMYLYPTLLSTNIPVWMTYGRKISPNSTALASIIGGKKMNFTSAAGHMLNHLKCFRHKFTSVYNFTPVDYYVPNGVIPKEHLMFLGRIEDIKGTYEAIQAAIATNDKLIIAGNIQPGHDEYFNNKIKPYLSNPLIKYVGPVNDEQKRYYLQRAKALLFPIKWEEPFGIVMIEAMACGVPVIAFRRGSVPEVIKHGITGFIVDDVNGMINSLKDIDSIDRQKVREDCVNRFSLNVISQQYLFLFKNYKKR
jgi:glycosyltransferase involved in cell wall biosynthesis